MKLTDRNLCFLDLETTGFDPNQDSIIEVSFIIRNPAGKEIDRFDEVIIPDKSPLNDFVSHLTGITESEIAAKGKPFADVAEEIKKKIGSAPIIGHNIDFDINFLAGNGLDFRENGRIDTHELARIFFTNESSYSLEVLSKTYGFTHENAHRAMSDVEVSIELYDMLVGKINNLPSSYLEQIHTFLEEKTDWLARELLWESKKTGTYEPKRNLDMAETVELENQLPDFDSTQLQDLPTHSLVLAGDHNQTTILQKSIANKLQKCVIITPKIDFFREYSLVPVPEILLDPERLNDFANNSQKLNNQETTFYLQCVWRDYLGYHGKDHFNLFHHQNQLWNQVNCQSIEHPVFRKSLEARLEKKIIVASPLAFFRLWNEELFKDRTLIVDETEIFADSLMQAPVEQHDIRPYLENKETTNATQFWIRHVCEDIIKTETQHDLPPFPIRTLLPANKKYDAIADSINNFTNELQDLKTMLSEPRNGLVRWVNYFPKTGNVAFGSWHPDMWRALKNKLKSFEAIFFIRNSGKHVKDFLGVFCGIKTDHWIKTPPLSNLKKWIVPEDLISAKSPDFNHYCADKIKELCGDYLDKENSVVASFSSLESLKKVFNEIVSHDFGDNKPTTILGEGASGGRGKIMTLLGEGKHTLLFTQKLSKQKLTTLPFSTLIIQRFPFGAPSPLLEKIEQVIKESGRSFWDIWTMIQTSARLSRKVANFPHIKRVICLDGRENARWGRDLVRNALPECFK